MRLLVLKLQKLFEKEKEMEKLKEFYLKHEEIINYLWVGILTTIVSWVAKFVAAIWLDADIFWQNMALSTINWVSGVIFGYFANRAWVFKSKDPNMFEEGMKFAGSRLSTYFLDMFVMWLLVNVIGEKVIYPKYPGENILVSVFGIGLSCSTTVMVVATLISAVLVTIINYIFSKLFVFKKEK